MFAWIMLILATLVFGLFAWSLDALSSRIEAEQAACNGDHHDSE